MAAEASLALPPAAPPARPRVLLVGTALASAACFMTLVGLVGVYLSTRAAVIAEGVTWLPKGANLPLTPGNIAMATFVISAVTMWWSVDAVGRNDRQMAYLALALTIFFGIAVLNATSFLLAQMELPAASTAGALIYTTVGVQMAMLIAAMLYAGVMTFRTLGGEYQGRDREGVVAAAVFWYVNIAAYAVIWYAIFVTK